MLTVERLKELLTYEPDTGLFVRRITIGNARACRAGEIAGYHRTDGYVCIYVDNRRYLAHRLAWLYMTGEWPTTTIDHWDHDESNNRWENLRLAGQSMNNGNMTTPISNTSGAKGVSPSGYVNKPWRARLQHRTLGYFATVEEAKACYDKAARELYKEFFNP